MNNPGDIIDNKYKVISVLNTSGGMGEILEVHEIFNEENIYALKYSKTTDDSLLDRFRREVRIMEEFVGNSKVVQIIDHNLKHSPPYFVMPKYVNGDLNTLSSELRSDFEMQERVFLSMADCIHELHIAGKHHRDIKPANFLRTEKGIAVSDLGLGTDILSSTCATMSHQWGGTREFMPPEFFEDQGFKNASKQSDIFMLGKSYYNLLTGKNPQYIDESSLEIAMLYLIERCCEQDPSKRYKSIAELKQGIVDTFDILLDRLNPIENARSIFSDIETLLSDNKYKPEQITKFIEKAKHINEEEFFSIICNAPSSFYSVLSSDEFESELQIYLQIYEKAIKQERFLPFEYAENIAKRMERIFYMSKHPKIKAKSLEIAIYNANRMNRFAAMSTCTEIIINITEGDPVQSHILDIINHSSAEFIRDIEASSCKNKYIANAISKLNES